MVKFVGLSTFPGKSSLQNVPFVYKKPLLFCNSFELFSKVPNPIIVILLVVIDQISNVIKSNAVGVYLSLSQIEAVPCRSASQRRKRL